MQIKQNQPTTKKSDSDGDVEIKTSKTISNNLKVVKELESTMWVDLKKGNKIALGKLYDIYIDSLFAFGIQNSQDRSFVMDCIHDLFLDLYKYRSTIKITDNSKNYLFKSLKRKINKRYLRKTSPKSEEFIIYKNKIFKNTLDVQQKYWRSAVWLQTCENNKNMFFVTNKIQKTTTL